MSGHFPGLLEGWIGLEIPVAVTSTGSMLPKVRQHVEGYQHRLRAGLLGCEYLLFTTCAPVPSFLKLSVSVVFFNWAWWHAHVVPAFRSLRQEGHYESEGSVNYLATPCLKTKQTNKQKVVYASWKF